ncbi:hypothetical protein, partial [Nocardiopsis alba]|uniref:hypothetical protein n=1 Tax=Nocardiopsis alba TaxID=53437 RepID=UPI0033E3025D
PSTLAEVDDADLERAFAPAPSGPLGRALHSTERPSVIMVVRPDPPPPFGLGPTRRSDDR